MSGIKRLNDAQEPSAHDSILVGTKRLKTFEEPLDAYTTQQQEIYTKLNEILYNSDRALDAAQVEVGNTATVPVATTSFHDTYIAREEVVDAQHAYNNAMAEMEKTVRSYRSSADKYTVCMGEALQHLASAMARLRDANDLYNAAMSTMHAYEVDVTTMRQTKARYESMQNAFDAQMCREQEQASRKAEEAQRKADQEEIQRKEEEARRTAHHVTLGQTSTATVDAAAVGIDAIERKLREMAAVHVNACLADSQDNATDIISSRPKMVPKDYVKDVLADIGMYASDDGKKNKAASKEVPDAIDQEFNGPECPVCFEPATHALGCGHVLCGGDCLKTLKICPKCRVPFDAEKTMRVYL